MAEKHAHARGKALNNGGVGHRQNSGGWPVEMTHHPSPYKTRHVLNAILQRAFREGRADMSPMKAQKILFYVHGWHLATTGGPAIDQNFEVWPYGPVVESVYHDLKKFGGRTITDYVPDEESGNSFVVNPSCRKLYQSLDIAWEKYIGIPAVNLSAMTHEFGSPWQVAKSRGMSVIPNEMVRDYFVGQARKA